LSIVFVCSILAGKSRVFGEVEGLVNQVSYWASHLLSEKHS